MDETAPKLISALFLIAGALFRGFVCGIFPAAVSLKRGNTKYAKWAVLICMSISPFVSLGLSVIVSVAMLIVILKRVPAPPRDAVKKDLKSRLTNC